MAGVASHIVLFLPEFSGKKRTMFYVVRKKQNPKGKEKKKRKVIEKKEKKRIEKRKG